MPFTGPNDEMLPEPVKGLPENERKQWVSVWNTSFDRCVMDGGGTSDCEGVAFRNANGVLFGEKVGMFDLSAIDGLCFIGNQVAEVERRTVGNADFLVSPGVLIKAGVLNDELVPLDEIEAHFSAWNGRPVVINHPRNLDGVNISANHPPVLDALQIGKLFNVYVDGDALKGELWIDVARAQAVHRGKEVVAALEDKNMLEISTAYFRDQDVVAGSHNGLEFTSVARNLRPDHLAILPDVEGACSIRDGCGTPRVNKSEGLALNPFPNEHSARLVNPGKFDRFRRENDKFGAGIHAIWGIDGETVELQAIRFDKDKFSPSEAKEWLSDHDHSPIEFEEASDVAENIHIDNGQDKEQTEQQAQNGLRRALTLIANALGFNQEETSMDELVTAIMGDGRVEIAEETLRSFPEAALSLIASLLQATVQEPEVQQEEPQTPEPAPAPSVVIQPTVAPAGNEGCDKLSALVEAVEKRGGAERVLGLLDGLQANESERRDKLVTGLAANAQCALAKEQLEDMATDALEALERSFITPDYSGQGSPTAPATNRGEQRYELPSMYH